MSSIRCQISRSATLGPNTVNEKFTYYFSLIVANKKSIRTKELPILRDNRTARVPLRASPGLYEPNGADKLTADNENILSYFFQTSANELISII